MDFSHLSSNQWIFHICHQTSGLFVIKTMHFSHLSSNQWTFHICHQTNRPFKFVPRPSAQWRHSLIDLIMGMQMAARWAGRDRAGLDVLLLLQICLYACIIHFVCVRKMRVVAWLEGGGGGGGRFGSVKGFWWLYLHLKWPAHSVVPCTVHILISHSYTGLHVFKSVSK